MNVISCSRRTDIPRCYPGWLEERLAEGMVEFRAPRGALRRVSLEAGEVHSIVLWSKDYGPLLERAGLVARLSGLNPYFHLTVTGLGGTAWEPEVPPWRQVATQAKRLVEAFGPGRVNWRFDPILHWPGGDSTASNLDLFPSIGGIFARAGVGSCTFSFAQWYIKSRRRAEKCGLGFIDPTHEQKLSMAGALADEAEILGIRLESCADGSWTEVPGIGRGRCIDAAKLGALREARPRRESGGEWAGDEARANSGGKAPAAKDPGQRAECGCATSIDIGSYTQRCAGSPCVYCYAN